ncbi:MAG: FMN-binding protein [Natronincolaceae bacterium]|jgi:uncharacterized protein with FMN-binding domain
MKKAIVLVIILVLVGLFVLVGTAVRNNIVKLADKTVVSDLELASVEDGIYKGEFSLLPVRAVVQVSVEDHQIQEIKILEHQNGLGEKAETIIDRVIEKQGLDVDVVSGATVSSKVMLKAIENALVK